MCGTPLGSVVEPQSPSPAPQPPIPQPQPPQPPPSPFRPSLKLSHSNGKDFYLPGEAGVIGRRSKDGSVVPEIDLSGIPDEGIISRSHARLYWDNSQRAYAIVDSSRNGTYLNGKLLTPDSPYHLNHGDELQLGQNQLVRLKVLLV